MSKKESKPSAPDDNNLRAYIELLGKTARDRVTGLQGIVISVGFDLFGCVQAIIRPPMDKDGKLADSHWFDVNRLKIVDHIRVMDLPTFARTPDEHQIGPAEKPTPAV